MVKLSTEKILEEIEPVFVENYEIENQRRSKKQRKTFKFCE